MAIGQQVTLPVRQKRGSFGTATIHGAIIKLQPANPAYPVISVPEEQVRVQGVVIGVLRRFS